MNKPDSHKQDGSQPALLHGRLKNVSLRYRTAELHRYNEKPVPLRFDAKLDHKMIRHMNKYIEVEGRGVINADDEWDSVCVDRTNDRPYGRDPFDLEAFLNNPNPKIFDPDDIVTAREPFDVDEFLRIIYEGRNARTGDRPR